MTPQSDSERMKLTYVTEGNPGSETICGAEDLAGGCAAREGRKQKAKVLQGEGP